MTRGPVGVVYCTTLVDQARDRRSLFAAFAYALFGPVLMLILLITVAEQADRDRPVALAVAGWQNAPTLVRELERRGLSVERRASAEPELGAAEALLVIPADYGERYRTGRPASVTLYRDERSQASEAAAERVGEVIRAYGSDIVQSRLLVRGVAAEVLVPIRLREANISAADAGALAASNMLLYFFLLAPFFASMSPAIDATAGERERGSLGPLLAQPIAPSDLLLGKWAVAATFGAIGTIVTVVLTFALLGLAPLEELGMAVSRDVGTVSAMAVLLLPLALAVAAAQLLVALLAKSFKEGQTYIQFLTFAPVLALVVTSFSGSETEGLARYLSVTGHADMLRRLLTEGRLQAVQALLVTLVSLAVMVVALFAATRRLKDERILRAA